MRLDTKSRCCSIGWHWHGARKASRSESLNRLSSLGFMQGLGVGDHVATVLAGSLHRFPDLEALNMKSNRLHPKAVIALFEVRLHAMWCPLPARL